MPGSTDPFDDAALRSIFQAQGSNPLVIHSRESNHLEFTQAFSLGACRNKLRTFAAFANREGGYIVFGIKDSPREMTGISGDAFSRFDPVDLSKVLNNCFAPEIGFQLHEYEFAGKRFGIIYVEEAASKPIVCLKNHGDDDCRESAIYYRYRGQTKAIQAADLQGLIAQVRETEQKRWMKLLEKIASIGVSKAAVLDSLSGEVTGQGGQFLIDEALLEHIKFIREGHFTETDAGPALRIVGDVEILDGRLIGPVRREVVTRTRSIQTPEIIEDFLMQATVEEPARYIDALCFQSSPNLPVYYFLHAGKLSFSAARETVDASQSTQIQKMKQLRKRLKPPLTTLPGPAIAGPTLQPARASIIKKRITANTELDTRHVFQAISTLSADELPADYLFEWLFTWYRDHFQDAEGSTQSDFRRALCHIDRTLFANLVTES